MPSIPFYVVLGPGRAQFGILVGFSIAYITLVLGAGACYRMDSANISYCEKSLASAEDRNAFVDLISYQR